jgi:vanillate O-demethylase ferredoxin subunit
LADRYDWIASTIVGIRDLAADVREFRISPPVAMSRATPGSHLPIRLNSTRGSLVRTYSLLDGGEGTPYRIAVKRVRISRGGSATLWVLSAGDMLDISAPRNNFPLSPSRSPTLLIAGGIGITPIMTMARALHASGADVRMIYAARHRSELVLHDELAPFLGDRLALNISSETSRLDFGAVFRDLPADASAYVCGPLGMLEAARTAWHAASRRPARFRFETFGAANTSVAAFDVHIPRLGKNIAVAANETLLDALERAGVAMISDCRKGECGICALTVLRSDQPIDHRDVFFSQAERRTQQKLCTCVSRVPGGTLVLDTADRDPP